MTTIQTRKIQEGQGSAQRPLAADLLKQDSNQRDPVVTEKGNYRPDPAKVNFGFERYYDPEYAKIEYEKIFLKTWLVAAREEDIPNVGDRVPFNVGPGSFIISRSGPDEFKAFYNVCRHRGAMLCSKKASGETIKCPVHGWEWKPNGRLSRIPGWWDFPDMTLQNGGLHQVRVGRWGGFIFINADPDARPLEEELGVIPRHFASFDPANRYTAIRMRKTIRANWKIGQEPFQESYHVSQTHGLMAQMTVGDVQSEYDIWKDDERQAGVGRIVTNSGVPSMNAPEDQNMAIAANVWAMGVRAFLYPEEDLPQFDAAGDTRKQMADWHRDVQRKLYNRESNSPDTVMTDVDVYFLFPNTLFHLSEMLPYEYSLLPHPTDPEMCVMDIRLLRPCPVGQPRPPAAEPIELGPDDDVREHVAGLDFQGNVLQEDFANMELLQRGARAADRQKHTMHMGLYMETILRHWHATYDQYMAR